MVREKIALYLAMTAPINKSKTNMIRPAQKTDSLSLAKLHLETLTSSFLASLGISFLDQLYVFLIRNEKVWVYEENNEIKGFVSYSGNSSGMMKRFIIHCPGCLMLLAIKTLTKPALIGRFLETFRAPSKSQDNNHSIFLPSGELLSISVRPNCQATGIGSQLVKTLEDYLLQNQILSYKVVAGEELIGANKFYTKNGFMLVMQIRIHGDKLSNVYVKEIR